MCDVNFEQVSVRCSTSGSLVVGLGQLGDCLDRLVKVHSIQSRQHKEFQQGFRFSLADASMETQQHTNSPARKPGKNPPALMKTRYLNSCTHHTYIDGNNGTAVLLQDGEGNPV